MAAAPRPALRRQSARLLRAALVRWARGRSGVRSVRAGDPPPTVYILLMHAWGMGGTIRTALNLAGELAGRHEVEILSMVRRSDRPFFPFPAGVAVTAVDDQRPNARRGRLGPLHSLTSRRRSLLLPSADRSATACSLWTDLRVATMLRRRRDGVMIGTRPGLNVLAVESAPATLTKVGQEHMNFAAHPERIQAAIRAAYPRLDALVVLTAQDLQDYRRALPGARRLLQIPNAVPPLEGERSEGRSKTVVAAGRLTPQKDFGRLIAAWARVAVRHPDWRLRICGGGPMRDELKQLVIDRGLLGKVIIPGPIAALGEELSNASLFAMSSRFEGFPMVLLEALSKGLPVVSFDCPTGPREVIVDGVNGVLVRPGDVDGLAAAIGALIDDEALRRRCAGGALATAARYSASVVGERWEALLAELA